MQDEHFAAMTFQTNLHDFHSFKNLTRGTKEYMLGFESIEADELYLMSAIWLPNDHVYAMVSWKTTLFSVKLNATTTCGSSLTQVGTRGEVPRHPHVFDFDYHYDGSIYSLWGAIEALNSPRNLLVVYNEYDGVAPYGYMLSFSISGMSSSPINVSVHYYTSDQVYLATMESTGKGSVFKLDNSAGISIVDTFFPDNFDALSPLIVFANDNGLLYASSMPAASNSSATSSQIIVYGSDFDLDFSTVN
jgi:hypothetical protein